MRRKAFLLAVLLVAAGAPGARAQDPSPRDLRQRSAELEPQLLRMQQSVDRAAESFLAAWQRDQRATGRLVEARGRMQQHIRQAYELGPGWPLGAYLSASSPSDLLAIERIVEPAISGDAESIAQVKAMTAAIAKRRSALLAQQQALWHKQQALQTLMAEVQGDLAAAESETPPAADPGGAASGTGAGGSGVWSRFHGFSYGNLNAERLLRLLGPEGGRTCAIPDGLLDTGKNLNGEASWYGWENGPGTASGMVFDPKLFTAAHLTLPFGTFLRVRYRNKCAIVLINDRGPYVDGRFLDLSWGAAQYLGVSVANVHADILVPAYSV